MFEKFKHSNKKQKAFQFFLALFVVLIPWQTRWIFYDWPLGAELWEYGRISLYFSSIILFIAACFFALSHKKEFKFSHSIFAYALFLYFIIVSFRSPVPAVSYYYLFLIFSAILFAYLVKFVPKIFIQRAFLFSGLIQGILAISQLIDQRVIANKWLGMSEHLPSTLGTAVVEFADERMLRAYGSLTHPNVLGGFLFVVIFFGIYLWIDAYNAVPDSLFKRLFKKVNFWNLVFVVASLIISTYGILASFSRGAILALLVSLFSLIIITAFKKDTIKLIVISKYLIIFFLVWWSFNSWFPGAWSTRVQVEGRLEQNSVSERVDSFEQLGWDTYRNVFFGQGLGMNTLEAFHKQPDQPVYKAQPIHDIFLLMLAELGLIGMFFVINSIRRVIKSADRIDVMSTSLILGLMIIGLFDHYLWTSWAGLLLVTVSMVNMYRHHQE